MSIDCPKNIVTGNEYISLPEIRGADGAVESFSMLHMGLRGMILVRGGQDAPLFKPVVLDADGNEIAIVSMGWERELFWIPRFRAELAGGAGVLWGIILTPPGERGFGISLRLEAESEPGPETEAEGGRAFAFGIRGQVSGAFHRVNETKPLGRGFACSPSSWNGAFSIDLVSDLPVFSFAPVIEPGVKVSHKQKEDGSVSFSLEMPVSAGDSSDGGTVFWWGAGFEEVGAITAAKELSRKGWERVMAESRARLGGLARSVGDPLLDRILNMNLLFNYYFAAGLTIDTEEFVMVTSRSPRYYVSASYWDRDSLLWSFPSILAVDRERALEMLYYAFGRQIRNAGIHSRYIDGTVLEPGFELDELAAPLLALTDYAAAAGDWTIVLREPFASGIDRILKRAEEKRDVSTGLYETFLQPTDDPAGMLFLTYDNVLLWKAMTALGACYVKTDRKGRAAELGLNTEKLKRAVLDACIHETGGIRRFVWAVDGSGAFEMYDEPPGSLELLAWHGFITADDPVYLATVAYIRDPAYRFSFSGRKVDEIGCEHAPQPWILSLANSLLCGRSEKGRRILSSIPMDDGLACESVDPDTGELVTGAAFATCAGFLSFAMLEAFGDRQ
jgi:meiotically up-regulated gene 157 (Mug157) protein